MEPNQNLLSADIQVDSISHLNLKEIAMWGKLLAIVGFILSALIALAALFAGTVMEIMSGGMPIFGGAGILVSIIYLVIAAIYFALSLFMFRFATKMKTALETTDQENFNTSLYNLKMVYRITGIIVIIYLAILALALIVTVAAAMFASS
ncbi:MAG: hypothetical protein H7Y86_15035 [Rhizobacter sp.]|nr:hypothetical protein [Ferruginibacter sp.]